MSKLAVTLDNKIKMDFVRDFFPAPRPPPPPEGWQPEQVALLAFAIFFAAALLNFLERILISWKVRHTL